MPVDCSLMSAMLVCLTPEETDEALEDLPNTDGLDNELFLLERLGFISAGCSLMSIIDQSIGPIWVHMVPYGSI